MSVWGGGDMGRDHQLAGIKLLWLAGPNIGWRMPLSQCVQCIHIWPLTVLSPGTISQSPLGRHLPAFRVVYGSGWNGMCPDWFEAVSEMCDYIYIYIYIYAKAVKATWKRIKAHWVHIYFHWVEQLIGNNQWLKILISELEYVDLWITCVLIHCFTGGSHCPGWCGPEVYPSLPGSRMPVLRILTVDEKFGLGILWCPECRTYWNKEHLIKITPKLIIDHLSCTLSIASNGRIPGFFHCINSQTFG